MSQSVHEIRLALARVRRQGETKSRRYPRELRRSVVAHALSERRRGVSLPATASSLGVPYQTLCSWIPAAERGRFRSVTVKEPVTDPGLRLVTSQGHRIEGLTREDLAWLLRALS